MIAPRNPAFGFDANIDKPFIIGTVDNALPCSDQDGKRYRGIAVETWHKIAAKVQLKYQLVSYPTFDAAVDAAARGKVYLVAACHTYDTYRLNHVEYSIPYTSYRPVIISRKKNKLPFAFAARLFTSQRILGPAVILLLISFITALGFRYQLKDRRTLTEIWTILLIGSGAHTFINRKNISQIYLLALTVVRIVLMSIIVGTAASVVFQERKPDDLRAMTSNSYSELVKEGLAMRSGSSLVKFFDNKSRKDKVEKMDFTGIYHAADKEHLLSLLKSNNVANVLTSSDLASWYMSRLGAKNYMVSYEGKESIPRGFLFGATMSQATKQKINLEIAALQEDGSIDDLESFWLQNIE